MTPEKLLEQNRAWADAKTAADPEFFHRLASQQSPKYLWIGCSDSRVPANEIVGMLPGELFVHRNVANVVVHSDLNCLSVLQYAVNVLRVEHVMVVGHYGCGGVEAALDGRPLGLIDNWLRHVQDVREQHHGEIAALPTHEQRHRRLCELNVARAGRQRVPHDDPAARVGERPGRGGPRLDLRPRRRPPARAHAGHPLAPGARPVARQIGRVAADPVEAEDRRGNHGSRIMVRDAQICSLAMIHDPAGLLARGENPHRRRRRRRSCAAVRAGWKKLRRRL